MHRCEGGYGNSRHGARARAYWVHSSCAARPVDRDTARVRARIGSLDVASGAPPVGGHGARARAYWVLLDGLSFLMCKRHGARARTYWVTEGTAHGPPSPIDRPEPVISTA